MERRMILMLFTALMVLGFFLLYVILSQSAEVPQGPGPSIAIDTGLLVVAVLCVSIGLWVTFSDKETQKRKKALLIVGLICGSVLFWFLSVGETLGLVGVEMAHPAAFNNLAIAGHFLFAIAIIMGLAAFLALILIVDEALTYDRTKRALATSTD